MAIGPIAFFVLAAPDVVEVPIQIAQNNQVKESVVVQINPGRAGGPSTSANTGLLRHIDECSIAIVMVELVSSESSHVEIFKSVVVVVAHSNAHAVTSSLQACLFCDVLECSVL